jgi:hypothetical protein
VVRLIARRRQTSSVGSQSGSSMAAAGWGWAAWGSGRGYRGAVRRKRERHGPKRRD